jgi:hypothetical protein
MQDSRGRAADSAVLVAVLCDGGPKDRRTTAIEFSLSMQKIIKNGMEAKSKPLKISAGTCRKRIPNHAKRDNIERTKEF